MSNKKENVVVSLSGGLDSSTLLLRCLKEYSNVVAISFDYGQKHRVELERAQSLINYIAQSHPGIEQRLSYQVIELDGLSTLLNSNLVEGGDEVPEGHYEQDNMKETVVPNRNMMFSSITQAVALSLANRTNSTCDIALGIHSGDHAVYPDCRQEFRDACFEAFKQGNWEAERVGHFTPYLEGDKFTILQDGEQLCEELGLEFNEVYKRTNTSYKPIWVKGPKSKSRVEETLRKTFGEWYSDYKSASSVERIEAFLKLGRPDPVEYADETGPVSWEVAKTHVEKVLVKHQKKNKFF